MALFGSSKIILLVEDDVGEAELIRHGFGKTADTIQHVPSGEEAVAYLSGKDQYADRARYPLPGLVLLDLKLPRMSGYDVLAWLRKQPGLERLPVVVLTGRMEIADINDAYDLGANFYLVKPVAFAALQDLVQTLKRILGSD